jgi:hypothetical protein
LVSQPKLSAPGKDLFTFLTPNMLASVQVQALFVSQNCSLLTEPILKFQSKSVPVAHLLHGALKTIKHKCNLVSKGQFGREVLQMLKVKLFYIAYS